MTIEITSVKLSHGVVTITAIDCSEEHLQYMERCRDDGFEKQLEFLMDKSLTTLPSCQQLNTQKTAPVITQSSTVLLRISLRR